MRTVYALLLLSLTSCLDAGLDPLRGTGGPRLDFTTSRARTGTGRSTHVRVDGRRIVVNGKAGTPTPCARLTGALSESGGELRLRLGAEGPRDRDVACGDVMGVADYRAVIWNLEPGEYRLRVLTGTSREREVLSQPVQVP